MDVLRIQGGLRLKGEVEISGAKNACLPIFAATLLTDEPCIIDNVPDLSDVNYMGQILQSLGAEVTKEKPNTWRIHAKNIIPFASYELVRKMRASVCLLGPLVGRLKQAEVSLPGGCIIGQRPIDLHLRGLEKLGCSVKIENGYVKVDGHGKLCGATVFLGGRQGSTVTGTANIVMTAVLTPGVTRIDSAACEPEIEDLCRFLVAMGAKIHGIGSHSLLIEGVDHLHGASHRVIGDRIEAGTYIIAGLLGDNDLVIRGVDPCYLSSFLHFLEDADITIDVNNSIHVRGCHGKLKPKEIITLPYPGYATDLQAQMMALLTITPGISIITERIWPSRFMHVSEMQRMGAQISIEGASAIINGQKKLSGAPVMASDLRASAALVLSGLVANGVTEVHRVYHIDRGYENIDGKLKAIGAQIERVASEEAEVRLAS